MKKLLSFVLVLAMLFSCVSMMEIVAIAEGNNEPVAVLLQTTADVVSNSNTFPRVTASFTDSDIVWDETSTGDGTANTIKSGTITRRFTVANNGTTVFNGELGFFGGNRKTGSYGWESVVTNSFTLSPQSKTTITLVLPVYMFTNGEAVLKINSTSNPSCYSPTTKDHNGEDAVVGYAPLSTTYFRLTVKKDTVKDSTIYIMADPIADEGYGFLWKMPATHGSGVLTKVDKVPAYQVINGDAELGTDYGWDAKMGGKTTIITEETGNHIAQFVPNTSTFATINFKLDAFILQDEANGYYGNGAGYYTVTFRAKAEEGNGGNFTPTINSALHRNSGDTVNGYTCTAATYFGTGNIDMTDEWKEFTAVFNVNEGFLDNIYNCYDANEKNASVYDLFLRLDGSGTRAFGQDKEKFTYYLDDVTISYSATNPVTATPESTQAITPVPTQAPTAMPTQEPNPVVGIKYEVTKALSGGYPYSRAELGLTEEDVVDGKITRKYAIYNTCDMALPINIFFQGGSDGWKYIPHIVKGTATVEPWSKAIVEVSVAVNEDNTVNVNNEEACTLDKLSVRVEVNSGPISLPAGVSFVVEPLQENDPILTIKTVGFWGSGEAGQVVVTQVMALPTPTPAPTPTAEPIVFTNGNAEEGMNGWWSFNDGDKTGTVTRVEGGANGTDYAMKFESTQGNYDSIAFDLAPAIINDAQYGFCGGGVGIYTVSFYAKAEEGYQSEFRLFLNSEKHLGVAQTYGSENEKTTFAATFVASDNIVITDEWQKFTVLFTVSENLLAQLKAIYESDDAEAKEAYQLVLRLEGFKYNYGTNPAPYYVDEINITKGVNIDDLVIDESITGIKAVKKVYEPVSIYSTSGLFAYDVVNGKVTKTFYITNNSETELESCNVQAAKVIRVEGEEYGQALFAGTTEKVDLLPGATRAVTISFDVNPDGTVDLRYKNTTQKVPVKELSLIIQPFNNQDEWDITVYGDAKDIYFINHWLSSNVGSMVSMEYVYEQAPTVDTTELVLSPGYAGKVEIIEENGEAYYNVTGVDKSYKSPMISIMEAVKKEFAENPSKEMLNVKINFTVRANLKNGVESFTAWPTVRANGMTGISNGTSNGNEAMLDRFKAQYTGTSFVCHVDEKDNDTNAIDIFTRLYNSKIITITGEWQELSTWVTLTRDDVNCGLWSRLELCFHNMRATNAIGYPVDINFIDAIQIKTDSLSVEVGTKLYGAQVDIGGSIGINFWLDIDEAHQDKDIYIIFKHTGKEYLVKGTQVVDANGLAGLAEGKVRYNFVFDGLTPNQMKDNIHATVVIKTTDSQGEDCYEILDKKAEYSIFTNIENLSVKYKDNVKLQDFIAQMANYGDATKKYAEGDNYNEEDSMLEALDEKAGVTENMQQYEKPEGIAKEDRVVVPATDNDNKVHSAGMTLGDYNKIYFRIQLKGKKNHTVYLNDVDVTDKLVYNESDGYYYIYTDDLKLTQYDDEFHVKVYENNGNGKGVLKSHVKYSANTYINSKYDAESDVKPVVQALNGYAQSGKKYQGK